MILLILLSLNFAFATVSDSDLSQDHYEANTYDYTDYFRADEVQNTALKRSNSFTIYIEVNNELISIKNLKVKFKGEVLKFDSNIETKWSVCEKNQNATLNGSVILKDNSFSISNDRDEEYEIYFKATCGRKTGLIFKNNSFGSRVLTLYKFTKNAFEKLKLNNIKLPNNEKINIEFPGRGNVYDFRKVHVTNPNHWDVVGHEIGHAIYDKFNIGEFGTGEHFIDKCYFNEIALSEGWASFFSAWLSIDLKNPNASFEYMVPRRAPLAIEHIPSDVCLGPTNEWRVFSFLWDLIDLNEDNENININFKTLWDLTINQKFTSITDIKNELIIQGHDPIIINVVWNQNILNQ